MKQAKVLTQKELRRVLAVIDAGNHAARNKCAFYLTHLAGLRVKEVAALKVADIYDNAGTVHGEIRLVPDQTKGNSARSVVLNRKLQKVLADYLRIPRDPGHPFHGIAVIHSTPSRSLIPRQAGQRFHGIPVSI